MDVAGLLHPLLFATTLMVPPTDPTVTRMVSEVDIPVQPFGNVQV